MDFKKFLMFEFMITPWLIRILYVVLQVLAILMGLFVIGQALMYGYFMPALTGIVGLLVSALVLRLAFESLMVMFKISENIEHIKGVVVKDDGKKKYTDSSILD